MHHLAATALRRLADRLDPCRDERPTFGAVRITSTTIFQRDERAESMRREAAMQLLDEQVLGYLVVRVLKDGDHAQVDIDCEIEGPFWPAVAHTLDAIAQEARQA